MDLGGQRRMPSRAAEPTVLEHCPKSVRRGCGSLLNHGRGGREVLHLPARRKRELLGVTGIAKQDNSADVEFEWKWVPLNEIGEALYSRDLRYRSSVGFRKYDDGWRLLETPVRSAQTMEDALKNAELIP